MDHALVVGLHLLHAMASLALVCIGLAVIFGMLRVINFAHGEFLMVGGYAFVLGAGAGLNLWVAMLVVAPAVVGALGFLVERFIIRHLRGDIIATILATWGLSLFLIGLAATVLGYHQQGVAPPFGTIQIGSYSIGNYTFFVIAVAVLTIVALFAWLRWSRAGLLVRGAMQNPELAAALGADTRRLRSSTFVLGSALSGLAGAVLAPLAGVLPEIGATYVVKAFITVISGGATALTGTTLAAALFGFTSQAAAFLSRPVVGEVALLIVAIVLLRLLPTGITGRYFRKAL
ncbi:MAG: branched-chain amino acid ABC transporter permease [Rhodospirillales bacterium]|nr:branched-chain amino acid ABC transporter permease [Rhodospirillales bacterium]